MSVPNQDPIKIVLIDKHTLVRTGLRMLLESYPGFMLVGDTDSYTEAMQLVAQQKPDVILLEINDDQLDDLNIIPRLINATENSRLLLVTSEHDADVHHRAAQLGAMGLVLTDQPAEVLVKAITKVHAGEAWFDRATIASVLTRISGNRENLDPEVEKIASLSPREREIILLVGEGLKNQQIAEKLSLSEITVRHHLTSIFSKLNVSDRLELIIYAYQNDLARLPR